MGNNTDKDKMSSLGELSAHGETGTLGLVTGGRGADNISGLMDSTGRDLKGNFNKPGPLLGHMGNHDNPQLIFKKVKSRRLFFDMVRDFVFEKGNINLMEIDAHFQYTTGASSTSIRQALAVLENLGFIQSEEIKDKYGSWEISYSPVKKEE